MDTPAPTPVDATLFPARRVRLVGGDFVTVEPWGLRVGKLCTPVATELLVRLNGQFSTGDLVGLVTQAQDEVEFIVAQTLGWTPEEMEERLRYEDLLTLAQAVLETCIMRGADSGGVLGKVVAMALQATRRAADELTPPNSEPAA